MAFEGHPSDRMTRFGGIAEPRSAAIAALLGDVLLLSRP